MAAIFFSYMHLIALAEYFRLENFNSTDYSYDTQKIEVQSGSLQLKQDSLFDGLMAYYKFEESSWSGVAGEVIDNSGNENNGKAFNGAQTITNT
ncbi:MAG: hypothetical protein H6767_00450 [Candidatus Peribacteria bacterium]|nr:MAG: hypothetical protein H6767_00450 [Candidatus Peribacteria bacterium]